MEAQELDGGPGTPMDGPKAPMDGPRAPMGGPGAQPTAA